LLALAIYFQIAYGMSFRHSSTLFSESGVGTIVLMFFKPYIVVWLIYHIASNIRGQHYRYRRARFQAILFVAVLILSLTAAMDVAPIAFGVLFIIAGAKRLRALFVSPDRYRFKFMHVVLVAVGVPVAFALAVLMVWIGYANKLGIEGTTRL